MVAGVEVELEPVAGVAAAVADEDVVVELAVVVDARPGARCGWRPGRRPGRRTGAPAACWPRTAGCGRRARSTPPTTTPACSGARDVRPRVSAAVTRSGPSGPATRRTRGSPRRRRRRPPARRRGRRRRTWRRAPRRRTSRGSAASPTPRPPPTRPPPSPSPRRCRRRAGSCGAWATFEIRGPRFNWNPSFAVPGVATVKYAGGGTDVAGRHLERRQDQERVVRRRAVEPVDRQHVAPRDERGRNAVTSITSGTIACASGRSVERRRVECRRRPARCGGRPRRRSGTRRTRRRTSSDSVIDAAGARPARCSRTAPARTPTRSRPASTAATSVRTRSPKFDAPGGARGGGELHVGAVRCRSCAPTPSTAR